MKSTLDDAFQSLATTFFLEHPTIAHEWRTVKNRLSEDRVDLVCAPGAANEVYASLMSGQIVVGDRTDHTDFGAFDRGLASEETAREAFNNLVELLRRHGHLEPAT
jgi:hypothetical protein